MTSHLRKFASDIHSRDENIHTRKRTLEETDKIGSRRKSTETLPENTDAKK